MHLSDPLNRGSQCSSNIGIQTIQCGLHGIRRNSNRFRAYAVKTFPVFECCLGTAATDVVDNRRDLFCCGADIGTCTRKNCTQFSYRGLSSSQVCHF